MKTYVVSCSIVASAYGVQGGKYHFLCRLKDVKAGDALLVHVRDSIGIGVVDAVLTSSAKACKWAFQKVDMDALKQFQDAGERAKAAPAETGRQDGESAEGRQVQSAD